MAHRNIFRTIIPILCGLISINVSAQYYKIVTSEDALIEGGHYLIVNTECQQAISSAEKDAKNLPATPVVIEDGIMRSGVIVRVLLLPSHVAEAKLSVKYLYEAYGDNIYISLMNQYTPMQGMSAPLDRKVTNAEYSELVAYAERIGVTNAFIQEGGTQKESFIPDFEV